MPKISALPSLSTDISPDFEIPFHNTTSGATEKITLGDLTGYPDFGWTAAVQTWSYSSWSSTTRIGVITVPSGAQSIYTPGNRVKITQSTGGTKYGIIHAVSDTTLTVFFASGTTLNNEAITAPMFSPLDTPFGFPTSPTQWQVILVDTTDRTHSASPAGNVWYNHASLVLTVGIGAWLARWSASIRFTRTAGGTGATIKGTLSTTTNSETHTDLTSSVSTGNSYSTGGTGTYAPQNGTTAQTEIDLAAQTTFNLLLNPLQGGTNAITSGSANQPTRIVFTSAYV